MATLFDDASLVMIPSGTKDGKLYSIKPTDGSGDFTFSRDGAGASRGTRVDSDGNIETGRTNYLLQSNQFDTTWTTFNANVTSGQADKDGGTDAWLLAKSGASGTIRQPSLSVSGVKSFSIYAKEGTEQGVLLSTNLSNTEAKLNLNTGALIAAQSGIIDTQIESAGNGFYRFTIVVDRSEEHTSELQSRLHLVCRLLLEKKKPILSTN